MKKIILICLAINFTPKLLYAATFCATTSNELHNALLIAETNGEDDTIKIRIGSYSGPFVFEPWVSGFGDDKNLTITGGWGTFFGNPCGRLESTMPFDTRLNGSSIARALDIRPDDNSNITISNLGFFNGWTDNNTGGGGLRIFNPNYLGNVSLINNMFVNNSSPNYGSALRLVVGTLAYISNNLFVNNVGRNNGCPAVDIYRSDRVTGVYFINNTVAANWNIEPNTIGVTGLRLDLEYMSQALIVNNVIWGNEYVDFALGANDPTIYIYNNDIGSRTVGSIGTYDIDNVSVDPMFYDGLYYKLSNISPLIDQGKMPPTGSFPIIFQNLWDLPETDIFGNMRVQGSSVDMGAYETSDVIFADGFE